MNWIERLYEIKNKDFYSQNGEGLIIESILLNLLESCECYSLTRKCIDIGCGPDGMYLSNTRHMKHLKWGVNSIDRSNGYDVKVDNVMNMLRYDEYDFLSIDIDGNDYWILDTILSKPFKPSLIVAEFNAMYTDSRTIAYNPDHVWAGDSYYGFTFEAGVKLAEKHGYKVIFQTGDMNMFMVRADLIEGLNVPPITYKQNDFFKISDRTDWVTI